MFKYLWIAILSSIVIAFVIVAIADIVKRFKTNYKFYIEQKRGGWKDVLEWTFKTLNDFTIAILIAVVVLIMVASFVAFAVSIYGG